MFYDNKSGAFLIKDIFLANRKKASTSYKGRNFTGISFRVNGSATFVYQNKTIAANTGSITYIPEGVSFDLENEAEEVIILHLKFFGTETNKIEVVSPKDYSEFTNLFRNMYQEWEARKTGYEHRCTAILYNILEKLEKINQLTDAKTDLIKKGVIYMNMHFNNPDLTIARICEKCNISEVYFRKIFKAKHSMTPIKYINTLRLNHACRMLDSGYYRVSEAAEMSGFGDLKYFSTAFKKHLGISPSEYAKRAKE